MKKFLVVLAVMAFTLVSVQSAYAFDLGGYVGKLFIKLSGYANGTTYDQGTNETNMQDGEEDGWGVGLITDIYKVNTNGTKGSLLWHDGQGGESLAYYYYGIDDWKVNITSPSSSYIYSVGGFLDLYLKPFGDVTLSSINAADRNGDNSFDNITDGTQFARYEFVPGIRTGDTTTTVSERVAYNQAPNGVFGSGSALADIADSSWGIWSNVLNTDTQKNGTDMTLGFTVSMNPGAGANGFTYSVDDPAKTAVAAPEPMSSALFLFGGIALAARQLRRNRKNKA